MRISKNNLLVFIVAFLSIYLIYVNSLGNVNFSIALFLFSLIGVFTILSCYITIYKNKTIIFYILYTLSLLIPMFYSNNLNEGIAWMVKNLFSILMICFGIYLYIKDKKRKYLMYLIYLGIPLAVLNIIFFFFPSIEAGFYYTNISRLVVSPSSYYDMLTGNFADPFKAGAFFINTNNASVYFIFFLSISFCYWYKNRSAKYLLLTLLYFIAQLCTGCRTGFLTIIVCIAYFYFKVNKESIIKTFMGSAILFGLVFALYSSYSTFFEYILSRLTLERLMSDPRIEIWNLAVTNFRLLGWGFGGWSTFSSTLSVGLQDMPQHNHLIILGYNGGILVIITYLLFWIKTWIIAKRAWEKDNFNGLILMFIVINIIVHGMFDNYFLGHMNILILLFVLLGYLVKGCNEDTFISKKLQ